MKILFVAVNREKRPIPVIPYGMCWVAAALREKGHEVEACDLMFAEDPRQELSRVIKGFNPQLIGVSIRNTDNQDFHDQKCYGPEIKEVIDHESRFGLDCLVLWRERLAANRSYHHGDSRWHFVCFRSRRMGQRQAYGGLQGSSLSEFF